MVNQRQSHFVHRVNCRLSLRSQVTLYSLQRSCHVANAVPHNVQLGDPMSFIGVTYRNLGEELLTGAEKT